MNQSFESALVAFCAPTLAGLKPAGLFHARGDGRALRRKAKEWDERLKGLGIRVRIVKRCEGQGASLVYAYRPLALSRRLSGTGTKALLAELGYDTADLEAMLKRLEERLNEADEFPHEIGVFLGYPLADVVGFMEHQGRNCTCCGCWKSYSDPKAAEVYFRRVKECTEALKRSYAAGTPLVGLAA